MVLSLYPCPVQTILTHCQSRSHAADSTQAESLGVIMCLVQVSQHPGFVSPLCLPLRVFSQAHPDSLPVQGLILQATHRSAGVGVINQVLFLDPLSPTSSRAPMWSSDRTEVYPHPIQPILTHCQSVFHAATNQWLMSRHRCL